MRLHLRGLIAAAHTPLHDDGSLALDRVPPLVEHLLAEGVDGLYVNGSTGEGPALRSDERRATAEAFVAATARRVPVLVQVGHHSTAEAVALAAHAEAIGADAISAVVLSYYPIADRAAIVDTMARIAAAAPRTPYYDYQIPALSGVRADVVRVLADAIDRIPTLAGIKYTAPTVYEFQTCVDRFGDRLDVLFGCDEMLLAGLLAGAHGAVGSTYTFAAPLYRAVIDAIARGDLAGARAGQGRAVAMVRVLVEHGGGPAIKAAMGLCGFDCGPVRAPQRALDASARAALRDDLVQLGLFEWLRREPSR